MLFFLLSITMKAQIKPIGIWRDHLSMQRVFYVDTLHQTILAASSNGYFIFDPQKNEIFTRSKSTGLSDVQISVFSKQPTGNKIIIGYENGNMDVLGSDQVRNLPEILLSKITTSKKIFSIFWKDQLAYVATNFGIVVLDPYKYEILDTYFPSRDGKMIDVYHVVITADKIYASTSQGIKSALLNSGKLNDFRSWTQENPTSSNPNFHTLLKWGESLIASADDSLFINENGSWKFFYRTSSGISKINSSGKNLYIHEANVLTSFFSSSSAPQTIKSTSITQSNYCFSDGSNLWIGDENNGLIKLTGTNSQIIFPNGPAGIAEGQSDVKEGILAAVAGDQFALSSTTLQNKLNVLKDDRWKNYTESSNKTLVGLADFSSTAIESSTGKIFIGTSGTGLVSVDKDDKAEKFGATAGGLQPDRDQSAFVNISGLAIDPSSNLWMTNPNTNAPVVVKKKDGAWKNFIVPFAVDKNLLNKVLVDKENRKWFTTSNAGGLICFNDNNTIDVTSDDQWRLFLQGTGRGNLPSSNVLSVAEDQSGNIWVGTDRGIGIIQCGSDIFKNCDATLPIVQQDNFAGLLLANEVIHDIKIDGADRKWIASNNGVWLLSADAQKVIFRFTASNSKLLNDKVNQIAINGVTGEVFFMTSMGISSFRSTATDAVDQIKKPIVFPNPVPAGYSGTIGIKELPLNAWVKITELDGRLVYQTRSLGGQAIWNSRNYKGERVNSGVYLIVISNEDNSEHVAGKIFFIK